LHAAAPTLRHRFFGNDTSARRRSRSTGTGVAVLTLLILLLAAPAASADIEFCPLGNAAGQCAESGFSNPTGLAIDRDEEILYLADRDNNRIDAFTEAGGFLFAFGWGVDTGAPELQTCTAASGCQAGLLGSGLGQLQKPRKLALDNDPASPNHHFLYVLDSTMRVQVFDPTGPQVALVCALGGEGAEEGKFITQAAIDLGPGGVLNAVDTLPFETGGVVGKQRLQRFGPDCGVLGPQAILVEGGRAGDIAVASSGELWVSSELEGRGIRKFDASGTPLFPENDPIDGDISTSDLAIDDSSHLMAAQFEDRDQAVGGYRVITVHDPSGAVSRRFGYGRVPDPTLGLAAHNHLFVAQGQFASKGMQGLRRLDFPGPTPTLPPPGPIAAPPSLSVPDLGSVKATAFAEINPEGEATSAHFEYLTEQQWQQQGESFAGAQSTPTVPLGAEAFRLEGAEALFGCPDPASEATEPGKCLLPETTYRWRVVAANADGGGEGTLEGLPFTTKAPLEFGDLYATEVGPDSAALHAELNPHNVPTSAYFEYVDDGTFQQSGFATATRLPDVAGGAAPLDFGFGEDFLTRGGIAFPLAPGTTYHYRLIATDPLLAQPLASQPATFTALRASQQQSCPQNIAARIGPGAFLPDCRAYELVSPIDKGGGDIRVGETSLGEPAVLEQVSLSGERLAYGSYTAFGGAPSGAFTSHYLAERIAGSEWRSHPIGSPRFGPGVPATDQNDREFFAFSGDLCEGWLTPYADLPPELGAAGAHTLVRRSDRLCGEERYRPLAPQAWLSGPPRGLSASGEALFRAREVQGGATQLYLSTDGAPVPVCLLPDGTVPPGCEGSDSYQSGTIQPHKLSADGSHVIFSADLKDGSHRLYLRLNPTAPESARLHGAASGAGDLIGPAAGKGNTSTSSALVKSVKFESGTFAVGQQIADSNGGITSAGGSGDLSEGSSTIGGLSTGTGVFALGQTIEAPGIAPATTVTGCTPAPLANGTCPGATALTISAPVQAGASQLAASLTAYTTIAAIEETSPATYTLTLSAKATKFKLGVELAGFPSQRVLALSTQTGAFQAGQQISAAGLPPGTTVLSCAPSCGPEASSLTLSSSPTQTRAGAHLSATSPCTEAEQKACTLPVSAAAEEAKGAMGAVFWGAAADGSRAVFSVGDLSLGNATLYSFGAQGETTTPLADGLFGVMGLSDDAERIYFSSGEVLATGASAGEPNLYLYDAAAGGATSFVATLAQGDVNSLVAVDRYGKRNPRVAPDGHAAFTSTAPLGSYDNTEAAPGDCQGSGGCREVYLYDADAQQLICASCNPSGSRPAGESSIPHFQTALYAARALSDDGSRLYFESGDSLVPRDTNDAVDVYQWEVVGTGSCEESSPAYSALNKGCLDLISSGQSHLDSRFVEADPSGENVFLATASSLLPQDPGGFDIYDARVGGGLPIPASPHPGCEGEACQSPPDAPEDPSPASSSYQGPGNVVEEATDKPCPKGKRRRHGRCVKKAKKKHAKHHHRRSAR